MYNRFERWPCLLVPLALVGCTAEPPAVTPPAPVVSVAEPIARQVTDYEDFTGRTDAVSTVDIRARVSGYLVKVSFKDGDVVKQGDLLYEIDPRPFQEDLERAKGQVERLEAEKKLLAIQVERYRKLAEKGAGSQQDLDQYLAQQAENVGALKAAHAQVGLAELNLGFTKIEAPITGQISRTLLTAGNLVNADTTRLTTLVSIEPMYAYFNVEEPTMLRVRKMARQGLIHTRRTHEVEVRMGLADDVDRTFPYRGTLDFVNNALDPQTGTILIRGVFSNPYKTPDEPPLLSPGMFVRVRLSIGLPHEVLLVTERAIGTDQGEKFVYIVGEDNKVVYRRVKLGLLFDGLQAIESGLKPGDRVVVNGLQRIRPGIQVQTEAEKMADLASPADAEGPDRHEAPKPSGKPDQKAPPAPEKKPTPAAQPAPASDKPKS
jgi:RND family efflux transporter MFP subunit